MVKVDTKVDYHTIYLHMTSTHQTARPGFTRVVLVIALIKIIQKNWSDAMYYSLLQIQDMMKIDRKSVV